MIYITHNIALVQNAAKKAQQNVDDDDDDDDDDLTNAQNAHRKVYDHVI